MARDYGIIPERLNDDPRLARVGPMGATLYLLGRSRCDSYGRLPGDPELLIARICAHFGFRGHTNVEDIRELRDALVQQRLWHLYTVDGVEYIEIEDHDQDQAPSNLSKRGSRSMHPDPPDRPDLWVANRSHYVSKTKPAADPPPPQPPTPARVPPRTEEQSAVSAGETVAQEPHGGEKVRDSEDYRLFERSCRDCHLDHWLNPTAFDQLYARAVSVTGRQWQILFEVAREAIMSSTGRSPNVQYALRIMENLPAEVLTRVQARDHFEARRKPAEPAPQPLPPDEEDDPIAARVREQSAALLRPAHAG